MAINGNVDIEIRLRLANSGHVPGNLVIDVLKAVSDAVYASELADLRSWREEFPALPPIALDAAEHRLGELRSSSVLVKAVDRGSLEIAVVVTGLAIWVLQTTLGETLKQAWLDSPTHGRLKPVLSERRFAKAHDIRQRAISKLERKLPASVSWRQVEPINDPSAPPVVEIEVVFLSDREHPPSRSDALRRWDLRAGDGGRQ